MVDMRTFSGRGTDQTLTELINARILKELAIEPGDSVLDIGCGGGTLMRLATSQGAEVVRLSEWRIGNSLAIMQSTEGCCSTLRSVIPSIHKALDMIIKPVLLILLSTAMLAQTLQKQLDSGQRYVASSPGIIQLSAPLVITANGQTVDLSATTLVCNFDDDCIKIGNASGYNTTSNVTVLNPHGSPTVIGGTHSFIVVYGQKTRIINVSSAKGKESATFGHLVTVVGDQAFLLDGLDTTAGGFNLRCDEKFCGSWVYAPGPFSGCAPWCTSGTHADNAALGWLTHMQLSAQCQGNGVDWQSGNTLHISDSVIQGYAQFGVRGGIRRGGYGGIELDNVYEETGCRGRNPLGNVGSAGVISQGGSIAIHSDRQPHGDSPIFASSGSIVWHYYVTMNRRHGPYGTDYHMQDGSWSLDSVPLYLGSANVDGKTPVTGHFPSVDGVAEYRVLRVSSSGSMVTPQGTGNWLVAIVSSSSCTSVCSFTDKAIRPAAYTTENPNQPNRDQTYTPDIWFWPGDMILLNSKVLANEPAAKGDHYVINSTWRPGN